MDLQDAVNRRVYHAAGVDLEYDSWDLNRCEVVTLLKYQPAFAGRDILDLGVGPGRTAMYLAPLARRYEAIDYSPVMVKRARANLPDVSIRLGDIRNLSAFADQAFDLVFATNNVFDAVSHIDRAKALAEARRVLRVGGLLIFSSHNRSYRYALSAPQLTLSRNPVTQIRHTVDWVRCVANHLRIRKLRRTEPDYALLDDAGHNHACLHYYVDPTVQRRYLTALGFRTLDVFDRDGREVPNESLSPESSWLMYVAERAAGAAPELAVVSASERAIALQLRSTLPPLVSLGEIGTGRSSLIGPLQHRRACGSAPGDSRS